MTDARQVPALVAAHQDAMRTTAYRAYARSMHRLDLETSFEFSNKGMSTDEKDELRINATASADFWLDQQIDRLNIAALFHITEPMMAVGMAAAIKLDGAGEHDLWSEEILPARVGFIVFEKPLYMLDARGIQTGVSAASWHIYHSDVTAAHGHRWNIEFAFFADAHDPADAYGEALREDPESNPSLYQLGRWHFVSAGALPIGSRLGPMDYKRDDNIEKLDDVLRRTGSAPYPVEPAANGLMKLVGVETEDPLVDYPLVQLNLYRYLYAVFALMQTTVTGLDDYTDKRLARRIRNRRHRPLPMVTVINLRHAENYGAYDEGTGRWLTYRSLTRAHWRRVHTKEGVRRTWVTAYWRGGTDLPVWQPARVTTLRR